MANELKPRFDELSRAIQSLHRDLLMLEARVLATESGRELTPYELLNASLNDARLAWLRELSALIVYIDSTVDEAPNLTAQEASAVVERTLALLDQPARDVPTDFWTKYTRHLGDHPDLILKHARVKDLAQSLKPKM